MEDQQKQIMQRARQTFLEELAGHLAHFRQIADGAPLIPGEERKRLHTIKGGAGFFGFPRIEKLAADLEKNCESKTEDLKPLFRDFYSQVQKVLQEAG